MRTMKHWAIAAMAAAALTLAGCGGGGSPTAAGPDPALIAARTAAMTATDAAKMASDDAMARADAAEANKSADPASYSLARQAADAAMDAYMAAKEARDAAAETTDTAEAKAQQAVAVAEQAKAEAAKAKAMEYADKVSVAHAKMVAAAEAERLAAEAAAEAQENQRAEVSSAIDTAMGAVEALSDTSTDAEVMAAEMAIEAAEDALDGADLLAANQITALERRLDGIGANLQTAKAGIDNHRHMVAVDAQRMAVSDAIAAAQTAVDGLTDMSTDAEVTAVEAVIAAAKTALNEADLLSGSQSVALRDRLSTVEGNLVTAEAGIAAHRAMVAANQQLMMEQRMAANTAIGMANTAVADLSETSTDEEVMAAKDEVQAAKDAVTAATALSMSDRDGLNERISTIEMMLASTETAIGEHRQMVADENQRMGVSTAITAAMDAVGALDAMSTDEEVNAAKALIEAADTALTDATSVLTAEQALALRDRISTIEMTLATTEVAIATQRDMDEKDAETRRVADVAAARAAAMQSYMDADRDAMMAEADAEAAEEAAPGSAGAMAAKEAATAARMAANAAMAAHDAIMDDMTKAEADAQAVEAATQAETANTQYAMAKEENNTIQTAKTALDEQQRVRDIADAKAAAKAAVGAAMMAKTSAEAAATAAETARDTAMAQYMKAIAARTDATMAKAEYEKAKAAATMAREAAGAANNAYMAAKTAADGIMDDGTAEDAQMAQMTAEKAQTTAETAQTTAETEKGKAETAQSMAMTAAGTRTLTLFLAANGAHVMDLESTPDVDEKAVHVTDVGAAMALIAAATDGDQAASTTAEAEWPGDTVDDPSTPDDESEEGMFSITVNVGGDTEIVSEFGATRAADSTVAPAVTARTQTAREIAGLGVFRGYELWEADQVDSTVDRARVIVFTNKTQDDPVVETSVEVEARKLENVAVTPDTLTKLGTKSGNTYTGAEYTPTGQAPLMGTLTCPSGTTCSVDATTDADGDVTINAVTGYVFTGSRAYKAAVTAMDAAAQEAANNYLVFGLWLNEGDGGADDAFGAFADGGTTANAPPVALTGTATYTGKAAGAHHKTGDGVNWFDGDASLTAKFGSATEAGTISGAISNIRVAGGDPMSTPIYLGQADLDVNEATFDGAAFMGEPTAPGASTHEFDGTWSGSFFGQSAAVEDDPDTTEDETLAAGALAPAATAGTFGVTKSMGTGEDMVVESYVGAFGAHKQ